VIARPRAHAERGGDRPDRRAARRRARNALVRELVTRDYGRPLEGPGTTSEPRIHGRRMIGRSRGRRVLRRREVLLDLLHRDRPLSHGRRDPLD
jgi:hypothetical protein